MKLTGGGRFDPTEEFCYFGAGQEMLGEGFHGHKLMAITEFSANQKLSLHPGEKLMVDSAAFVLAQRHARANDVPLHVALATPVAQLEGFDWLYQTYIELITRFEDQLWGYVEIDLGGTDQKRQTRAMLEGEGLRPIPVYHIASDGWAYFDELASAYDRICIGNLVNMQAPARKRALVTLWERRRRHPGLRWIHLLGYTPSAAVNAYPANSADSTSWGNGLRYGGGSIGAHAMQQVFSRFDNGYSYPIGNREQWEKCRAMLSMQAHMVQESWRASYRDLAAVMSLDDPYPAPLDGEPEPRMRRSET